MNFKIGDCVMVIIDSKLKVGTIKDMKTVCDSDGFEEHSYRIADGEMPNNFTFSAWVEEENMVKVG